MNQNLPFEVLRQLRAQGKTLATAESCTGGLIGKLLTDVPGSSEVYMGGVISYTNGVKHRLLGVSEDTLRVYTAVSRQTAHEMARRCTRGCAGRRRRQRDRPRRAGRRWDRAAIGLVYIGIDMEGFSFSQELHLTGDRAAIREQAAEAVLNMILEYA